MTVVLLRGINVSGHRKVPMAELRDALAAEGLSDARTYIQSGNVVLDGEHDHDTLVDTFDRVLQRDFGLDDVPIVVRTSESITHAMQVSAAVFPLLSADADVVKDHGRFTHVVFLGAKPSPTRRASLAPDDFAPDRFHLDLHAGGADLHVSYHDGVSGSKLLTDRIERAYGVSATGRNLNTVSMLASM